jgi:hypothetical protein
VEWVVDRCRVLHVAWRGRFVVEQTGTAGFLIPALEQAGVRVDAVPRRFYVEACAALDVAVRSRMLRHGNQHELNDAVAAARWSSRGEAGERVLSRRDPRVSPLVAAALGLHGLASLKPRGGRLIFV